MPKNNDTGRSERIYRRLLRAYPKSIRDEYGEDMARCFRDMCREAAERGGASLTVLWVRTMLELFRTALRERSTTVSRSTYRTVIGVALATAFILACTDLAISAFEEPDGLSWLAPIGFFAAPVLGGFVAFIETRTQDRLYRLAFAASLAAVFFLAFANLAVGVVGSEGDPANLMYIAVLAVGAIGATVARLRAGGMVRTLLAMALAQTIVAAIALLLGRGEPLDVVGVNGFFVALFVGSALLFALSSRQRPRSRSPEPGA